MKRTILLILILTIVFSSVGCGSSGKIDSSPVETKTKDEIEELLAKDMAAQFKNKLTPKLKDPKSFQFVSVDKADLYYVEEDGFFAGRISFVYTATNSFGGRIQDTCYGTAWGYYDFAKDKIKYDTIEIDVPYLFAVNSSDWYKSMEETVHNKK